MALLRRGRRGALEIGLVVLVCGLAAGAVIGSGLAQTVLATPNPLTWLRNSKGQVVQVNPETGTMLQRLQVGASGDQLQIVQDGSILVVTNPDGTVTTVDLSTLRVAGVRQGDPAATKVVLAGGHIHLVNKALGQIETLDPLTAATVGQPYRAGAPLSDVVADSTNALWALTNGGRLATLRWSDASASFTEVQRRDLPGAGPQTVLVAHAAGMTALSPGGSAVQVGTGQDRTVQIGGLAPPLAAADLSPASLVPVSSIQAGNVHLVRGSGVVEVEGPPLGCNTPSKPAVYRDRVYVPCPGNGKVVVLDGSGRPAEPELKTPPGRDLELVLNAGLLFVNVADGRTSLVVKPDGSTQPITTDDPRVTVNDPDARPTALPSGLGIRPQAPDRQGQDPAKAPGRRPGGRPGNQPGPNRGGGPGGQAPDPTLTGSPGADPSDGGRVPDSTSPSDPPTSDAPPTSPAPRPEDFTPTRVIPQARTDGQIDVSWTAPPNQPASYNILRADNPDQPVGTESGDAATTIVGNGLTLGESVRFIVEAVYPDGKSYRSQPSDEVIPYGIPGKPDVAVELVARAPAKLTLRVTVTAPTNGGSTITSYGVSVTAGTTQNRNMAGSTLGQPNQFEVDCGAFSSICLSGGTITATATLQNAAGSGPEERVDRSIQAQPQFEFNGSTMFVSSGGKCLTYSPNVANLAIAECTGSTQQLWSVRTTGEIRPQASFNQCLSSPDGLHYSTNCGRGPSGGQGPPDDQRWDVLGNGNIRGFRNQDTGRCLAVNGSPSAAGTQVKDLRCTFNNQDSWYLFTATLPVTASALPASFTPWATQDSGQGGLGEESTVALLLLPLAAGVVRQRRRRRHAR
jgi:Ricin-type beta-trefoil lectin domain